MSTTSVIIHMATKYNVIIVVGKDQDWLEQETSFTPCETWLELLLSVKIGPSKSVSERRFWQDLHAMNIWIRVHRKNHCSQNLIKLLVFNGLKITKRGQQLYRQMYDEQHVYSNDAHRRVHRRPHEAFDSECVKVKFKSEVGLRCFRNIFV